MRTSSAKDQRRGKRGTVEARNRQRQRQHWRLLPSLMVLEQRTLLSNTYTVTNLSDASSGSLRWAINLANTDTYSSPSDVDTIQFSIGGTITLTGGQLELSKGVVQIIGPTGGVTVSGNIASRVFQVDAGVTATIKNLKVVDGKALAGQGGGIYNNGNLNLTNDVVSGNQAGLGGGLYVASGTVTLNQTTFSSDSAKGITPNQPNAGLPARFHLSKGNPQDNDDTNVFQTAGTHGRGIALAPAPGQAGGTAAGGGIYVAGGTLTITNSVFSSDSAEAYGGGRGGSSASSAKANWLALNEGAGTQQALVNIISRRIKFGSLDGVDGAGGAGGSAYGGGLMVTGGAVTITNTIFSSCDAMGGDGGTAGGARQAISAIGGPGGNAGGGALAAMGTGSISVLNTTFNSNTVTGGHAGDTFYASGPEFIPVAAAGGDGLGGAVYIGTHSGAPTICNSTFLGNSAFGGGTGSGVPISATAQGRGGGLMQGNGALGLGSTVSDCTFSGNFGTLDTIGNGSQVPSAQDVNTTIALTLNNNILSDILSGGTLTGGHNLIADASYSSAGLSATVHGTAKLGGLANNGGPTLGASIGTGNTSPTLTLALLTPTSQNPDPAIAAGSYALLPSFAVTDERGHLHFDAVSHTVDIGAYQLNSPALTSIAVTPTGSSNPRLLVGVAGQFTAMGTFADGTTVDLTSSVAWASATPVVVTIGGTGLARALPTLGTTVITASAAGVTSAAVTLTVLAQSFVVNTTGDDIFSFYTGATSLRQAIAAASFQPGDHTITFDPTVFATAQTITLAGAPLLPSNTSGKLTIQGPASSTAALTISGNNKSRVFQIANSATSVEFDNLTITAGLATDNGVAGAAAGTTPALGGGLLNMGGNLTFTNVAFTSNKANGAAGQNAMGGAVYTREDNFTSDGSVSFTNCIFTSNTAQGGNGVAGSDNTVAAGSGTAGGDGYGGGVAVDGGSVSLNLCTFTSDQALGGTGGAGGANTGTSGQAGSGGAGGNGYGGGLMYAYSPLLIQTTTFDSCRATGGAGGRGGDNTSSTVKPGTPGSGGDGHGGGLALLGGATAYVQYSTFSLNTATGGKGGDGGNNKSNIAGAPTIAGGSGGAGQGGAVSAGNTSLFGTEFPQLYITNTTVYGGGFGAAGGSGGTGGAAPNLIPVPSGAQGSSGIGLGGGLLFSAGFAVVSNCTFANLYASAGGGGDLATFAIGTATVNNTILGTNTGGAIISSFAFSGAVTSGSTLVTPAIKTPDSFVGMTITASTGSVIQPGTTIQAIDRNSGAITLSKAATSTGPFTLQVGGTLTGGYNLIADGTSSIAGLTNTVNNDPGIGGLANNGGPTKTMAIQYGSAAIGKGRYALVRSGVTTDQRVSIPFTGTIASSGSTSVTGIASTTGLAQEGCPSP
jgi:fibronectin-binding autotransporter adhesin